MRAALLGVACCALLLPASLLAQPQSSSGESFGDRQAGHFGDPGAGYFGNTADGNFTNQSLDSVRAKAAENERLYGRKSNAPSPYILLEQPVEARPKKRKTPAPKP